jgi:hypothetical protein
MCRTTKAQIERDVLAYLAEHHNAQDTLEGIVEWWLVEQSIRHRTATIETALSGLIERKYLVRRKGIDARVRYRLNRRKLKEITALIDREYV